jgi:apolipoprotein D and lipocalin family protein
MRSRAIAALSALLAAAVSCGTGLPPPPTVPTLDLARYAGRWYEIARLPAVFQRACVRSWAEYVPLAADRIGIVNACETADGERRSIRGEARVIDAATNARLLVTFDTWFAWLMPRPAEGNYWVLALDAGYDVALVGTPDRRYLWILARTPRLAPDTEAALIERARLLGFDVARLLRDAWPAS